MAAPGKAYGPALERAAGHARAWLDSVPDRPVPPRVDGDDVSTALNHPLPDHATAAEQVVDELAAVVEPGLMASPSGRFFGWVMGGTQPAPLAADWLVSAWDQNTALLAATPGTAAVEEAAGRWLLDLLGLPTGADVGFVTGATMASFTGLAAARQQVLTDVGWDLDRAGLTGAPRVRVLVGAERHDSVDLCLRYLGLGAPTVVPADRQGRMVVGALEDALAAGAGPAIVCLQAGNLHSGAFDPLAAATEVAHENGAWVHVDGAFGLWAAASPRLRELVAGYEAADSWATDAHKTLNVPYDCGIAVVAHPAALRTAMGMHADYLAGFQGAGDPFEKVPELSRRARGVTVWAALRALGRDGVAQLVDRLVANARALARGVSGIDGAHVVNEVVFTQVCVTFGTDARTRQVTERVLADGVTWMSGSRWQGRDVLRMSVSSWATDAEDVAVSVESVRRAVAAT